MQNVTKFPQKSHKFIAYFTENNEKCESNFNLQLCSYMVDLGMGNKILKHRDSFGKEKKRKKTCSIFDRTLSKVFLNNFHALNRS